MPSGTSLTALLIPSPSSSYLPFAAAIKPHELSTGAIVGITVGAILFGVFAIITLVACSYKRQKERRRKHVNLSPRRSAVNLDHDESNKV
jgi:heme/copper-type cytochrome/quinol oxidase subunit 2